jgi:hypothetical protein
VLEKGADVQEIVNMAAVAVIDAQERSQPTEPVAARDKFPAAERRFSPRT